MHLAYFEDKNKQAGSAIDEMRLSYILFVLEEFFTSKLRDKLVLGGMNAAKFAYNMDESDNKLVFITLSNITVHQVLSVLEKVEKKFPKFHIDDNEEKRYTHTINSSIRFEGNVLPIEIDVTKMVYDWELGKNYFIKPLGLKDWTKKFSGQVQKLDELVHAHPELVKYASLVSNQ
ncbi:MAG TPA: hypothetical protein VGA67_01910 [Candidatus Dojkabacteria bacterium]|jgi:hypothetical protein